MLPPKAGERRDILRHAMRLELFTIGWDMVEGVVAVTAGLVTGSTALVGFGIDSAIEVISAGALYWRLRCEWKGEGEGGSASAERRALQLVSFSFFALATYVSNDAITKLVERERPSVNIVGIVLAAVATAAMPPLVIAKRRAGKRLESEALIADSRETMVSTYMSGVLLAGLALTAALSWWWADAVAALAMLPYILWSGWKAAREARE